MKQWIQLYLLENSEPLANQWRKSKSVWKIRNFMHIQFTVRFMRRISHNTLPSCQMVHCSAQCVLSLSLSLCLGSPISIPFLWLRCSPRMLACWIDDGDFMYVRIWLDSYVVSALATPMMTSSTAFNKSDRMQNEAKQIDIIFAN